MEIFKLFGSVMVDTGEAEKSLHKTDETAKGVGDTLLSGAKSAGKFALGLGTAAAGAVTALVGVASSAAETSDTIDKASQRMNITAESYQELSHAASLCGVEMSTMEKAAKKLEGTDLSMDDALEQIYALETAEERSALAAELFGDTVAYQMSPMLNASASDMEAMKQEAHDLGLVLSDDAVKSGAELNDALNNVKDSVTALGTNLGAALMPIVKEGCDAIIEFMPTIMAIIDDIAPTLNELMSTLLPILMEFVQAVLPPLLELVNALLPLFTLLCELILPILTTLIKALAVFLADVFIPIITKVITAIKTGIDNAIENLTNAKNKVVTIFEAIKEGVKKPINAVIGMINSMIDALNALSFDVPDWVPVLGGKSFGFNLSNIPMLANGGSITDSGSAIVGESGAELVNLPTGASVTPLTRGETALNADRILATLETMQEQQLVFMQTFEESIASALNNVGIKWNDRELARMVQRYA